MEPRFCPKCQAEGLKSEFRRSHASKGGEKSDSYYDEKGKKHRHGGFLRFPYECSNGHSGFLIRTHNCPTCYKIKGKYSFE